MREGYALEDAKAQSQEMTAELIEHIPEEWISSVDIAKKGTLWDCPGTGRAYRWMAVSRIFLTPEGAAVDGNVAAEQISNEWAHLAEDGYVVGLRVIEDLPSAAQVIDRATGELYSLLRPSTHQGFDGPYFRLNVTSECFILTEGIYPGGRH